MRAWALNQMRPGSSLKIFRVDFVSRRIVAARLDPTICVFTHAICQTIAAPAERP